MNKEGKKASVAQLNERFSRANVAILAEFSGMSVEEIRAVRNQLREADGEFKVVKNKIAIRAAIGTAVEGLNAYFKGSTAVALGYADPIGPTKALKAIADKQKKLIIKAGVIEGQVIDLDAVTRVSKLPSKNVLIGELIGRFNAPITGFAGSLNGILGKFVRILRAYHEKRLEP